MSLAIYEYRLGKNTYTIDFRSTGGNIKGSYAYYDDGTSVEYATSGSISITKNTVNTVEGTFDVNNIHHHLTGTFIAPLPE